MKTLLSYFRLTSVRTAAIVYFLIAGALTRVPLFNYLGFEFSAAMTIPAALVSGLLSISFIRIHVHQAVSRRGYLLVVLHYTFVNLVLLLIPLAVISLNALVVKNCSFSRGLMYFALLPVCTVFFCISLGVMLGTLFMRARTVFLVLIAGILSHILIVTYAEPQLFAYNFVLGFFPGITYDEVLNDISTLFLYREFTIIASLLCLVVFFLSVRMVWSDYKFHENVQMFRLRKGDGVLYAAALVCAVALAYGHFHRDELGFQYSAGDIQRSLGGRAATTHFILYYPADALPGKNLEFLKAEAEFHYAVAVSRMKESLKPGEKISVYLYPSAEAKRRFIGTSTTNIAKPWRQEMHLTLDSFDDAFRHELTHVLAAGIGVPVIHASLRMALNEGLAGAIDWEWETYSPHEYSAALQRDKLLGDPEELFGYTGFATQQSSYAYVVTASFSRYLIDRFGVRSFKCAFPSGHFVSSYGMSLQALIEDWKNFLRTVEISSLSTETIRTLFAQQSIFRKTCARVTAERNTRAVQAIRLRQYAEAEEDFAESFEDAQTSFALRGLFQSLLAQKKSDRVVLLYDALNEHSMLRYNPSILCLLGDAFWLRGDVLQSLEAYRRAEEMNISGALTESAALRRAIVREPRLNRSLQDYFFAGLSDSARTALLFALDVPGELRPVVLYLRGLELLHAKKYGAAGDAFRTLVHSFADGALSYACAMNAARAFYRAKRFEDAKGMFWQSQNFSHSATTANYINEWIDRCDAVASEIE